MIWALPSLLTQNLKKARIGVSDTRFLFVINRNYTSSMIAISAASPRRAPVRVTLV